MRSLFGAHDTWSVKFPRNAATADVTLPPTTATVDGVGYSAVQDTTGKYDDWPTANKMARR